MDDSIKIWLTDIKNAIDEIDSPRRIELFLPAKKDFYLFRRDTKTKRAIERNLEIIGEAVNRILQKNPDAIMKNARKIVDTRNRIAHGYDTVRQGESFGQLLFGKFQNSKKKLANY